MAANTASLTKDLPVGDDDDDDDDGVDWPSKHGFRFMNKNGRININYSSMGRVKHMHANIILFVMKAKWSFVLTLVLLGFLLSWFFFAFLYFLVSIEHGDFVLTEEEQAHLDNQTNFTRPYAKARPEMCVKEVHNFLSALLFSIETQHTIGYGSRYITTECLGGILVLTLQCSLGYLLQVIVTQIVFSKLSRPTEQSQFVVFSDHALIVPRDNRLTLTFRIGNLSLSQLIFASVRLLMIRPRRTLEGEIIPHQTYDMELTHLRNGQLFFPRPTVIEHIIDSRSPLYGIHPSNLASGLFEIIAIIEGTFDYTGFSCHFRTSYLPTELRWGYQFSSCDCTLSGFDYQKFNSIEPIADPLSWSYDGADRTIPNTPNNTPYLPRRDVNTNEDSQPGNNLRSDRARSTMQKTNKLFSPDLGLNDPLERIPSIDGEEEEDETDRLLEEFE